jgi:hypothetical protein
MQKFKTYLSLLAEKSTILVLVVPSHFPFVVSVAIVGVEIRLITVNESSKQKEQLDVST